MTMPKTDGDKHPDPAAVPADTAAPAGPAKDPEELSDEELDSVSGGFAPMPIDHYGSSDLLMP